MAINKDIIVKRLKRTKMRYLEQSITTNGKDFITVYVDDNDGGFEHTFNKTMSKELFKKLKNLNKW